MKILITTGVSSNETGGPAMYGVELKRAFEVSGHEVKLVDYKQERKLPPGIRHLHFFVNILPLAYWSDSILALDTFSVGMPSVAAGILLNKKIVLRVGGDFLWESYVSRTGQHITLRNFNENMPKLNFKESLIFRMTRWLCHHSDWVAFNTEWQRSIWIKTYSLTSNKTCVVRNFIPEKIVSADPERKVFIWAGRKVVFKNVEVLEKIADEIRTTNTEFDIEYISDASHNDLLQKIKDSYAVVLPSLSDVCPNFILESIAYCKPFVMTKETGMDEICNIGGIFVDPLDSNNIEYGMRRLLNHEVYAGYKKNLENFDVERTWRDVAADFEPLLSRSV